MPRLRRRMDFMLRKTGTKVEYSANAGKTWHKERRTLTSGTAKELEEKGKASGTRFRLFEMGDIRNRSKKTK